MTEINNCQIPTDDFKENSFGLDIQQLNFTFEGKTDTVALKNVSCQLDENRIHAIIGASGSGKSTLLKLISGLLQPQSGTIHYKGERVLGPFEKLVAGHSSMRLVSQNFDDLNLYANVFENVSSELSNTDLKTKQEETFKLLKQLRIEHLAEKRIFDLSGGEKQRVAIARALITQPEVLLMDEPFNQVDASFRENLQEDIRDFVNNHQIMVVLVSHDPAEVLSLADNLIVMKEGEIIAQGSPKELFDTPTNAYTAKLLAKANVLSPEWSRLLGIDTKELTIIHQHHIEVKEDKNSPFYISKTRFKGFYIERTLQHKEFDEFQLQCIFTQNDELSEGTFVQIVIRKSQPVSN